MSETWITEADLAAKYGADEVARLADVDRDGMPDEGVVEKAILSVEGRLRSRLLTRYRPEQLPTVAPEPLLRVTVDLTWYELHKGLDLVSDAVLRVRQDALDELDDLVEGLGSLDLGNRPPVDSTRPQVLTSPSRPDRMTLKNLDL